MTFLEALAKTGLIEEGQVAQIARLADEKFAGSVDRALLSAGIDEIELLKTKSDFYKIPIKDVSALDIPQSVMALIPEDSMRHYGICPLEIEDGVLHVGIVDPEQKDAIDAVSFIASKSNTPFKLFLITNDFLQKTLGHMQGLSGEVGKALSELPEDDGGIDEINRAVSGAMESEDEASKGISRSKSKDSSIVEEPPIIKAVGTILRYATEGGASDIHIEPVGDKVKVRFRVDGTLHTSLTLPWEKYLGVVARIKILAKLRLDEKRKPQDGGFSVKIANRKVDFRVSTFPTYYGEKIVMRILDQEKGVRKIDDLDLSPRYLEMVKRALKKPYGLIIISGPTGSGKSTTLYSMLNEMDRESLNVVSLEDPVEFRIDGVHQSQVMPEIGYTFETGLRSILRQDPNVIMVGEMRDKETAQLAIQAALTGHLVLSTLHTNSAVGIIPRLIDMGIDPYLIAPTLVLAVAQRLARRTQPEARREVPFSESMQTIFAKEFADMPEEYRKEIEVKKTMIETVPTPVYPDGTKGRMAIFEMFEVDDEVEHVILNNPVESELYQAVRRKGMITMKEDAMLKAVKGDIPIQDIYKF